MKYKLKKQTVNIVWVSPIITPLMFSPEWFRRYELIREEDLSNSNSNIGVDVISTDYGWLEITCTPTKAVFQLTKSGLENTLADLVSSILAIFTHAETRAIGINTLYIYSFEKEDDWNLIGDSLVPKALWKETNTSKILQDDVEYHYGMRNLVVAIENTNKQENCIYNETINVTYASSRRKEDLQNGLQVQYNHDLSIKDKCDPVEFTNIATNIIAEHVVSAVRNDITSHESMFERILS